MTRVLSGAALVAALVIAAPAWAQVPTTAAPAVTTAERLNQTELSRLGMPGTAPPAVAAGSTRVLAQAPNCVDLYNRVMAAYQTAPLSLEYNQLAATYGASCLGGAAAVPAYPGYYPQYYPQYYAPAYPYYGYAEPYDSYFDYGVPVAVGIGLGFGGGFHHGGGFRGGGFHRGGGSFRGGGFHHGGGGHAGGHGGGGGHHR